MVLHEVQPLFDLAQYILDQKLYYVTILKDWNWDFGALFHRAIKTLNTQLELVLDFDDRFHSVEQICNENGFGYESFNITTKDGYILRLDHVLPSNVSRDDKQRPVVLLQHGISDSSITWVINQPDKAVAFQLVRAGYDVWMGNNRGNEYSRMHATLDVHSYEYWDFDFEDMALSD